MNHALDFRLVRPMQKHRPRATLGQYNPRLSEPEQQRLDDLWASLCRQGEKLYGIGGNHEKP